MKTYGRILLRLPRWPLWGLAPLAVTSALALCIDGLSSASLQDGMEVSAHGASVDSSLADVKAGSMAEPR